MLYTLDTNAVSAIINGNTTVLNRWKQVRASGDDVTLNAITYYEVLRGLLSPRFARKQLAFKRLVGGHRLLPIDLPTLDRAAQLYHDLRSSGTLLEDADILVAAIALSHDAVLVTHNTRHFQRLQGLALEDWESMA